MLAKKDLTDAQLEIVGKVEKALKALNLPYAIKLPNGTIQGELAVKQVNKRPLAFPYGEIRAYVKPLIENIEVGQKLVIPADKYGEARVRSAACNLMTLKHGKDMAECVANGDGAVTVNFNCGLPE